MPYDRQLTAEETDAFHGKPAVSTTERRFAVDAAAQASARGAARTHGETARIAQAQFATLDTLRRSASDKADREARGGGRSRFGFYPVTGILLAALAVAIVWLR